MDFHKVLRYLTENMSVVRLSTQAIQLDIVTNHRRDREITSDWTRSKEIPEILRTAWSTGYENWAKGMEKADYGNIVYNEIAHGRGLHRIVQPMLLGRYQAKALGIDLKKAALLPRSDGANKEGDIFRIKRTLEWRPLETVLSIWGEKA